MLIDRLIFGCGHLTGGASIGEAHAVVARARAGGIRHFDTAPSYGIGTAEAAIGALVWDDPAVAVSAKVGSARPTHGWAKTIARRAVRSLRGASATARFDPAARPASGCFSPAFMHTSLAQSLTALRRPRVDLLLLHEAFAEDITPKTIAFLEQARADDRANAIGYSNSIAYDARTHGACPAGWVAQTAVDPALLVGRAEAPLRPVIFHSLLKVGTWLGETDPAYARGAAAFACVIAPIAPPLLAAALLPYYLAATQAPNARLIYTSSIPDRIDAFVSAAAAIDASGLGVAATEAFWQSYAEVAPD